MAVTSDAKHATDALRIEHLQIDDLLDATALIHNVIGGCQYYSAAARAGNIASFPDDVIAIWAERGEAFVVKAGARIVAFALADSLDSAGVAFLYWIGVAETHRGRGIGRALLSHVVSIFTSSGSHKVTAHVLTNNTPSLSLMLAAGLVPVAVLRRHWYGADYLILEKVLRG